MFPLIRQIISVAQYYQYVGSPGQASVDFVSVVQSTPVVEKKAKAADKKQAAIDKKKAAADKKKAIADKKVAAAEMKAAAEKKAAANEKEADKMPGAIIHTKVWLQWLHME